MKQPLPDGFSGFNFGWLDDFDFGRWFTTNFVEIIIMFGAFMMVFGWYAITKWG